MVYRIGVEIVLMANGRIIHRSVSPMPELKRFVEETGGGYFAVKQSTQRVDVNAAIAHIFDELHSQYSARHLCHQCLTGKLRKLENRNFATGSFSAST